MADANQDVVDLIYKDKNVSLYPQLYGAVSVKKTGSRVEYLDKKGGLVGVAEHCWSFSKKDYILFKDADGKIIGSAQFYGGSEYVDHHVMFFDSRNKHLQNRKVANVPLTTCVSHEKKPNEQNKTPPSSGDFLDTVKGVFMLLLGFGMIFGFTFVAFAMEEIVPRVYGWLRLFMVYGLVPLCVLIQWLSLRSFRHGAGFVRKYCFRQVVLTGLTAAMVSAIQYLTMEQGLSGLTGTSGWIWFAVNGIPVFFYAIVSAMAGFSYRKDPVLRQVTDKAVLFVVLAVIILVPVMRAVMEMALLTARSPVAILGKALGAFFLMTFGSLVLTLPARLVGDLEKLY